jgi:hypothetical protein
MEVPLISEIQRIYYKMTVTTAISDQVMQWCLFRNRFTRPSRMRAGKVKLNNGTKTNSAGYLTSVLIHFFYACMLRFRKIMLYFNND